MSTGHLDVFLETVRPLIKDETSDHQEVLHAVFDAIIRGDFEAFGALIADDVEFSIAGFPEIDGSWQGRDEVVAATRRNFRKVESQQPAIEGMAAQGNCIAVLLKETGVLKSTGKPYRIRAVQWFTFEDRKIKRIEEMIVSV